MAPLFIVLLVEQAISDQLSAISLQLKRSTELILTADS
jgi:hypothetical protein